MHWVVCWVGWVVVDSSPIITAVDRRGRINGLPATNNTNSLKNKNINSILEEKILSYIPDICDGLASLSVWEQGIPAPFP